ncbi:response regulator [Acidovorax cavernicola]|uniref:histidine kinase n=1 Tax=Acidovorax cavernicola TaxID=1675792 RepID=A0A9X8CZW1_9BURK|nr:response regulator [Acidovorax cavernicola]
MRADAVNHAPRHPAGARRYHRACNLRNRWSFTFGALAIALIVLAAVAMVALFNAKTAVRGFDERILPSVAKSLGLSKRVTDLAAAAPYVAEISDLARLEREQSTLRQRQQELRARAAQLPPDSETATGVIQILGTMQTTLDDLIEFKRQDLALRQEGRERIQVLDQLEDQVARMPALSRKEADHLLQMLRVALYAHNVTDLTDAEQIYRAQLQSAPTQRINARMRAQIAAEADNIFALRKQHLSLRDRKNVLLTSMRQLSEELTRSVDRHVESLSSEVSSIEHTVGLVVRSGLIAVVVALLVAAAALALGFWNLQASLRDLTRVTAAITELSHGNAMAPPDVPDSIAPRDDEVGALVNAFNVFRENTLSMRRMGADISEQRRLLRTVLDSIDDGLGAFDAEGRLVAWNPRFAALLHLPSQAVHTGATLETLRDALPPMADGRPAVELLGAPDAQQRRRADLLLDNGQVLAVRNHPMPAGGFVALYSDQSESRALERQVRQTQKMEVLGQLTGGVAHDFNNLLAAVFSNLQLLQSRDDLSPDMRRIVDRALRASERGAALTARLLAFARRQTLHAEVLDVDQMLTGLQDLIEYSLGQDIRVALDLQAGGATVLADGGQLENAILNLALNGGAAMPRGGVLTLHSARHVAVPGTATHAARGAMVEIRVSDTGAGMPPSVLEHIFEPFFSTKKNEGSGLGLSIVYGFVKQSGGDIRVESTLGQGTSFALVLPEASPATAMQAPSPQPDASSLAQLRVLLVDDDADVREATHDLLKERGAQVHAVASSAEAAAALEAHAFDLVLSDVSLGPGGDGLQLMHEVRRRHPDAAVVMVSGLPSDLLARRYAVPPHARILRKPFLAADLVHAMEQALAQHRADATPSLARSA